MKKRPLQRYSLYSCLSLNFRSATSLFNNNKCFLGSFKLETFVVPPHCKLSFLPCIDTCNNSVGPRDPKLVLRNFIGGHPAENSKKCWNLH